MHKPRLFIGSSTEALPAAYELQDGLRHIAAVQVWTQDVFQMSSYALPDILAALKSCDFGLFVLAPDDLVEVRGDKQGGTRDNVLLELGISIGLLGPDRSLAVLAKSTAEFRIPTDLVGIGMTHFDSRSLERSPAMAVSEACQAIRRTIARVGPIVPKGDVVIRRIADDPMFNRLLAGASEEVLVAGPTLLYMAL
jgi:predicted nucleotide-binding protein